MEVVTRVLRGIATFVAAIFGRWFKLIGSTKGCVGKALVIGGGLFMIACLCFGGLVALTATGQAVGLISTSTPAPTATLTRVVPTVTALPTATPAPASATPRSTATVEASATSPATETVEPSPTADSQAVVVNTDTPSAPATTEPPAPTATAAAPQGARVVIVAVNKREEYVDIQNQGDLAQDLGGWTLVSETGNQRCGLSGVLDPGVTLRIWAGTGPSGYSCGNSGNIWNNEDSDPAVLLDASGVEVSRR